MRDLLQKMKPDRIEDLIAANALYRPGPMMLIGDYTSRKHGQSWTLPHPIMEEVLAETYGIMVYQEQVMQILNKLGDVPLARAYKLVKAISKKNYETIKAQRDNFVPGCLAKGIEPEKAQEIFVLIERFGGYGFNKSHSTQYAILAFQTAYFKHYYPTEFMAALLTFEMVSIEKVSEYIEECRQMGIEVLPPDVNESFADFTVIYDSQQSAGSGKQSAGSGKQSAGASRQKKQPATRPSQPGERLRFGLAAVKGVGPRAVEEIIRARQEVGRFDSIYHLCEHVDPRVVNKGALEALIKAGAMDSLGGYRSQYMAALEGAIEVGNKMQRDKQQGQMSFFETFESDEALRHEAVKLPEVTPWPQAKLLQYEKEVLGMYVTDHPLAEFAERIHFYSTCHTNTLKQLSSNSEMVIGGIITRVRYCVTKNGRGAGARMALFTLEDLHGTVEGVIFPDALAQYAELIQAESMVFLRGTVDFRREEPSIKVGAVYDMARAEEYLTAAVYVRLGREIIEADHLQRLKKICQQHRGKCPVYVEVITPERMQVVMQMDDGVHPNMDFCRQIEALVGHERYRLLRAGEQAAKAAATAGV